MNLCEKFEHYRFVTCVISIKNAKDCFAPNTGFNEARPLKYMYSAVSWMVNFWAIWTISVYYICDSNEKRHRMFFLLNTAFDEVRPWLSMNFAVSWMMNLWAKREWYWFVTYMISIKNAKECFFPMSTDFDEVQPWKCMIAWSVVTHELVCNLEENWFNRSEWKIYVTIWPKQRDNKRSQIKASKK